jgi:outer membrane protein OmpA-like peptidoglycan-associated protein
MNRMLQVVSLLVGLAFLAASCATSARVTRENGTITAELKRIDDAAYICAPAAYGQALAEMYGADTEARLGNTLKSNAHLERAWARLAEVKHQVLLPNGTPREGCEEDLDGDGILNSRDHCPKEAEDCDGDQDEDGCPEFDKDADGIRDEADRCPEMAEDMDGFDDADGCPELDNDLDGIMDAQDQCPNQAEDFDGFDDENGCPDLDNDGDGLPDAGDKCPNQAEDMDGDQDDDGCPDLYKNIVVEDKKIQLKQKIFFATNGAKIMARSFELLDEVAQALIEHNELKVRIEGHTDDKGNDKYNLKLSNERAKSVRQYMITKGVPAERMVAIGYGETKPIMENTSEEGREVNRRVEFNIIEEPPAPAAQ